MATKKTKKIDTPIDNRETFVSIQKNFADSDIPVSEKLMTLYSLSRLTQTSTRYSSSGANFLSKFPLSRASSPI